MKRTGFGPRRAPLKQSQPLKRSAFSLASAKTHLKRSEMRKRAKPKAPKAEREHMGRVAMLSCVVCRNEGLGESPAEVHHVRYLAGAGQRSSNLDTLPLCALHHRLGGSGVAFHAGPEVWQKRYGTEAELLAQTKREMGIEINQTEIVHVE